MPNGRRITAKEFKRQQEQRDRERIALNDHRAELEQEEQDWKAQLNVAKEEMYAIAGSVQRMTIVQRTKEKDLDAVIEKLEGLKKVLETRRISSILICSANLPPLSSNSKKLNLKSPLS